jgi:hypothetical protein
MRVFLLLLARAMGSKASFCVTFLLLLLIAAAAWGPAAQADDAGIGNMLCHPFACLLITSGTPLHYLLLAAPFLTT